MVKVQAGSKVTLAEEHKTVEKISREGKGKTNVDATDIDNSVGEAVSKTTVNEKEAILEEIFTEIEDTIDVYIRTEEAKITISGAK